MNDELIELGLAKRDSLRVRHSDSLLVIIDRLLGLVEDLASRSEPLPPTRKISSQITDLRQAASDAAGPGEAFLGLAEESITAVEEFFRRVRENTLNREIEFIEIIDALREAVRVLTGQSEEFNKSLIGSSERFERLLEIDDLEVLKQQIVVESRALNRLVADKQKVDTKNHSDLHGRIERLQQRLERAEEHAMLDPLTQIANRGSFDRAIRNWVEASASAGTIFTLAMVDLDDFKQINDSYGHQVGDRVLVGAAQVLGRSIRPGDILARYGGEEFAVLLRGCPIKQATERFTEVLGWIASTKFEFESGGAKDHVRFTASSGLAEFSSPESAESLIRRADEALYEAKRTGKNRVVARKRSFLDGIFGG